MKIFKLAARNIDDMKSIEQRRLEANDQIVSQPAALTPQNLEQLAISDGEEEVHELDEGAKSTVSYVLDEEEMGSEKMESESIIYAWEQENKAFVNPEVANIDAQKDRILSEIDWAVTLTTDEDLTKGITGVKTLHEIKQKESKNFPELFASKNINERIAGFKVGLLAFVNQEQTTFKSLADLQQHLENVKTLNEKIGGSKIFEDCRLPARIEHLEQSVTAFETEIATRKDKITAIQTAEFENKVNLEAQLQELAVKRANIEDVFDESTIDLIKAALKDTIDDALVTINVYFIEKLGQVASFKEIIANKTEEVKLLTFTGRTAESKTKEFNQIVAEIDKLREALNKDAFTAFDEACEAKRKELNTVVSSTPPITPREQSAVASVVSDRRDVERTPLSTPRSRDGDSESFVSRLSVEQPSSISNQSHTERFAPKGDGDQTKSYEQMTKLERLKYNDTQRAEASKDKGGR